MSETEIQRRVREFSDALDLDYEDSEVELVSHLVREDKWPRRHPLSSLRVGLATPALRFMLARLSQLNFRPFGQ